MLRKEIPPFSAQDDFIPTSPKSKERLQTKACKRGKRLRRKEVKTASSREVRLYRAYLFPAKGPNFACEAAFPTTTFP
jgi:hypothetical protein